MPGRYCLTIFFLFIFFGGCRDDNEEASSQHAQIDQRIEDIALLSCERGQECLSAAEFEETYTSYDHCKEIIINLLTGEKAELTEKNADACFEDILAVWSCSLALSCDEMKNNMADLCVEEFEQQNRCASDYELE